MLGKLLKYELKASGRMLASHLRRCAGYGRYFIAVFKNGARHELG